MSKVTAKAKKSQGWAGALPERVAELRHTMEKGIRRRMEEAVDLLPPAPRKAVHRMTTNVERFRHDLRKRGNKAVSEVRKRVEATRGDMEKRVEEALTPLRKRFDVATRADVERLRKRLEHLERRLGSKAEAV